MSRRLLPVLLLSLLTTFAAQADTGEVHKPSANIVSHADVMQWMLGLGAVLVLFGLFVWLLRKSGTLVGGHKNELAVLSGLSLGMREKLVLVKVGEKQLLLGVTPGRVEKLMELEGESRLFSSQSDKGDNGSFAKKLQQALQGRTDA